MSRRERSPRPGVTWQQEPAVVEVVVEDGPWGGPATVTPWAAEPKPKPIPALNRAQRRAMARAARKRGRS